MQLFIGTLVLLFLQPATSKMASFLELPDPMCKSGKVSLDGNVCCAGYCGECNDYPTCSSVRGQHSENSCCKSAVESMECGHGARANVCLKKCSKSAPPCIMDFEFEEPSGTHAGADCNKGAKAIQDWRDRAEKAVAAGVRSAACTAEALTGDRDSGYRGMQTRTRSGERCMRWDAQTPHEHDYGHDTYPNSGTEFHSYCRNPGDHNTKRNTIWCFTDNPNVRWESCDPMPC